MCRRRAPTTIPCSRTSPLSRSKDPGPLAKRPARLLALRELPHKILVRQKTLLREDSHQRPKFALELPKRFCIDRPALRVDERTERVVERDGATCRWSSGVRDRDRTR